MIDRRGFLLGGLAAGAAVGLAACGTSGGEQGGKVTVGLTYIPNVQFSAFYLGVKEGLFAKHGLDVTLRHHGEQEDVFGALLRGDEQVVFASADEAMVAAAGGNDLRTFATSYQTYPLNVIGLDGTLTLPPEPLTVLEGRTLGIPGHFGSSYYAALCAIIAFFPMVTTTVVGLRSLDMRVVENALLDGASAWQRLAHVEGPMAAPAILAGVRGGVVLTMTGAVVGELVMGGAGLGTLLTLTREAADTAGLFAVVAWISLTSLTLHGLVHVAERAAVARLQGETT